MRGRPYNSIFGFVRFLRDDVGIGPLHFDFICPIVQTDNTCHYMLTVHNCFTVIFAGCRGRHPLQCYNPDLRWPYRHYHIYSIEYIPVCRISIYPILIIVSIIDIVNIICYL